MSYTALYRRFRPQLFSDLVGQEHISRTLSNAVRQGSFVHAYLFCGPRGTGKTSSARIMARAVNCLNPTASGEPCGECAACQRALQGEALDILEIDAASNRGIDEIRDLRERVKYAPALEKYKVYIIDEVHMLTAPAFNALLKTLEEPPPQVLFILATTEPHKMPLTVLSRCQRFDFRRIADSEVCAHLAHVAAEEGYQAEPEALQMIARKAEGGMRDALGLLDQCAGFNAGRVTVEALNQLTGTVDAAFIAEMTQHMLAGDAAALLTMVAQLHEAGRDLRQFLRDLLEYQRELLLMKLSPGAQPLPQWAKAANENQLLKLMQALSDGDGRLRNSLQPRLTLELALLSACGVSEGAGAPTESPRRSAPPPRAQAEISNFEAELRVPAEALQGKGQLGTFDKGGKSEGLAQGFTKVPAGDGGDSGGITAPVGAVKKAAFGEKTPPMEDRKAAAGGERKAEDLPPADAAASEEQELERLRGLWPQIVAEVGRANPSIGPLLEKASLLLLKRDRLTLSFEAGHALFMAKLTRPGEARDLLEQKISASFGRKLVIEGLLAQAEDAPPPPTDAPPEADQGSLF